MTNLLERRDCRFRGRLARLLFALAAKLSGGLTPRQYAYYAARIPAEAFQDEELDKIISTGESNPENNRVAMIRLAQEQGRVRREGAIVRLALHDAGILILPEEELKRLRELYKG